MAPEHKAADTGDQPGRDADAGASAWNGTDNATAQCEVRSAATREIVVTLGMHRSGTSVCMNLLQAMGVRLDTDLIPGDANNEPGYFESRELIELNEGILRAIGASWHTLFSLAMPGGWEDDPALVPAKKALRDLITRKLRSGSAPWGFKDPRATVLLPLYEQVFDECGLEPRYILCIRDPRAVAQSLKKRNQFPLLLSELLWLDYTMPAIELAGKRLQAIIIYEKWFQDAIGQAESLMRAAGLQAGSSRLDVIVQRVVASALNHADAQAGDYELGCSRSIYDLLLTGNLNRAAEVFDETWQAIRLVMGPAAAREALAAQSSAPRATADEGELKQSMPHSGLVMSQAFWRSEGGEFEELASARAFTKEGSARQTVRLPIPGLTPRSQLRLDPADAPGIAQLFGIRLLDPAHAVVWEWDGLSASLAAMERHHIVVLERIDEGGVFLYLPNSDPSLLLPVSAELDRLQESGGSLEVDFGWRGTICAMAD